MFKYLLAWLLLGHGLIHFMGFAKAFSFGSIKQLTIPISKPVGFLWLLTAFLFIVAAVLFFIKKENWWMLATIAVVFSQVAIVMSWKDAKFGTIANIVIVIAAVAAWGSSRFENSFRNDVQQNFETNNALSTALITEADLEHLPEPVQHYLKYVGVLGKPRVKNVRVVFTGQMRDRGKDWFPFTTEQYNFFSDPSRLFFMKATMFGVTVPGYHYYLKAKAVMDIRAFGLFSIVKKSGDLMDKAETVTLFNDLCLMAPSMLIDKRIEWQPIDSNSAKAIFTNHDVTISAVLYFNNKGQLINFVSNDRTVATDMKQYQFSTPCGNYKNFNGYNLQSEGDAVWHYPEGKFTYGKFVLQDIQYNVNSIEK